LTTHATEAIVAFMAKAGPEYISLGEASKRISRSVRSIQRALTDVSLSHLAIRIESGRIAAVRVEGLAKLRAFIRETSGNPNFVKKSPKK
jgi:hypothetical protein